MTAEAAEKQLLSLDPEQLLRLARAKRAGLPLTTPWAPLPGPQLAAFLSPADELLYGGQAGGGKTDLVIGLAATVHDQALIFRRIYGNLSAILERCKQVLGSDARVNEQTLKIKLAGGRLIELGAMQLERDKDNWQGKPHDLIVYDELPQFTETQFRFTKTWNRTTKPGQRCRVVATANPPIPGQPGAWIIGYWAPWLDPKYPRPSKPGELRWYVSDEDGSDLEVDGPAPVLIKGKLVQPRSRTFIPARVEDNPYLMASGYASVLDALPEPLRSMLREGRFDVSVEDDPMQVIPTAWIAAAQARWTPEGHKGRPMAAVGVDCARGGKDKMILAPRSGGWFARLVKIPGAAVPDGPKAVEQMALLGLPASAWWFIDVIGIGSSVVDTARGKEFRVVPVNFAEGSDQADKSGLLRFVNKRAECWWRMREALDPTAGSAVQLPPDPELLADLAAPRWELTARGIKIEDKDEVKNRIGRSPDCGDAVVMSEDAGGVLVAAGIVESGVRQSPGGARW